MGVRGLTSLLHRNGILPNLNKSDDDYRAIEDTELDNPYNYVEFDSGSTLAFDGSSLAFHLFRIAYHEYHKEVKQYFQNSNETEVNKDVFLRKISMLLPSMLPLNKLKQTALDYLQQMVQLDEIHIKIFLDGKNRRMKEYTDKEREMKRMKEETNLRNYCSLGSLPRPFGKKLQLPDDPDFFLNEFPHGYLWMDQIINCFYIFEENQRSNAHSTQSFEVIHCSEEADRFVALSSASDISRRTYSVGEDSDYIMFGFPKSMENSEVYGEVQYVPLSTLEMLDNHCSGILITRRMVANVFSLPNEDSLVEACILMGNDYTKHFLEDRKVRRLTNFFSTDNETSIVWNPEKIINRIVELGADYQIQSKHEGFKLSTQFTRDLFGFKDLTSYPFDDKEDRRLTSKKNKTNASEFEIFQDFSSAEVSSNDIALSNMECLPQSTIISYKIMAPFHDFLREAGNHCYENNILSKQHLTAIEKYLNFVLEPSDLGNQKKINTDILDAFKIQWDHTFIMNLLQKSISVALKSQIEHNRISHSRGSPCQFFHPILFHNYMMDFFQHVNHDGSPQKKFSTSKLPVGDPPPNDNSKTSNLPIDEHERVILESIRKQRVTIIQGETGCGKSSRVPIMILRSPPPDQSMSEVRMFVSQPRRIAAKSLAERVRSCEPDLQHLIGLRMGHGVREYETKNTRAWFVTTGYIVRLLANNIEAFKKCTHLVIDEVHERSVDTDILCLLARRLLHSHPRIRLVLMSATVAAELYSTYFNINENPIFVGVRKFPINEFFLEDLKTKLQLGTRERKAIEELKDKFRQQKYNFIPNSQHMEKLYRLAVNCALSVATQESSVLIFVPGMADIVGITELFDDVTIPGIQYICIPIHSDVPFDEQMLAFKSPVFGEIKIIVATNSAESSITLPDVDHVICLGLSKQIIYNSNSHRQVLEPCWISRASAKQRAGRTGRVREGNVYRLYPKIMYDQYLAPFDVGEMLRIPLDSVILQLREMIANENVSDILAECIDPPNLQNIQRSLESLHKSNFIDEPSDGFRITSLGSLVNSLGVDLKLGSVVGLGFQFGIAAEAIEIAAILSFPKSPWMITNPLFHDLKTYNEITSKTYTSKTYFDGSLFSEPMSIMNLLWDFEHSKNKNSFCSKYKISFPRMKRLLSTRNSLRARIATNQGVPENELIVKEKPLTMPHAKITIIRILHIWVFNDSIIEVSGKESPVNVKGELNDRLFEMPLHVNGKKIKEEHLSQVLDRTHNFSLVEQSRIQYMGTFRPIKFCDDIVSTDTTSIEDSFISYAIEKNFEFFIYCDDNDFHAYTRIESDGLISLLNENFKFRKVLDYRGNLDTNRRGRYGRACGVWSVMPACSGDDDVFNEMITIKKYVNITSGKTRKKCLQKIQEQMKNGSIAQNFISVTVAVGKKDKTFKIFVNGICDPIAMQDIKDLFYTPMVKYHVVENANHQAILFHPSANASRHLGGDSSSYDRPLLEKIPEGVGLISALASGYRGKPILRFITDADGGSTNDVDEYIECSLKKKFNDRWRRVNYGKQKVIVDGNNIPASAMSVDSHSIYACCTNSLELRSGILRVEGLTLLPPGSLFLYLGLMSFGLDASFLNPFDSCNKFSKEEIKRKIEQATVFHESCQNLGDDLRCYPSIVRSLCDLFNEVDGYILKDAWVDLEDNIFATGRKMEMAKPSKDASDLTSSVYNLLDSKVTKDEVTQIQISSSTGNTGSSSNKSNRYKCPSCGEKPLRLTKLKEHMAKCCQKQLEHYKTERSLQKKCKIKSSENTGSSSKSNRYKCPSCGEKPFRLTKLKEHMAKCCQKQLEHYKTERSLQKKCKIQFSETGDVSLTSNNEKDIEYILEHV